MLILVHYLIVFAIIAKVCTEQCEDWSNHHSYNPLNQDICGRSSVETSETASRIVHGNKTSLGSHPWMAIIAITKELPVGSSQTECAGTLISDQYVMTAASCFDGEGDNPKVKVWLRVYQEQRLSIINCDLKRCSLPPVMIEAESFVPHPNYTSTSRNDNIALVRLKRKVQFDEFLRPVCLPLCDFRSVDFVGTIATMLGWDNVGVERTGLEVSALEKSLMMVISRQTCQQQWGEDQEIYESQLCAGWPGGRAACSKDIGGPLLTETRRDGLQVYQIGVISQGQCEDNYKNVDRPSVFTKVADYVGFILRSIEREL